MMMVGYRIQFELMQCGQIQIEREHERPMAFNHWRGSTTPTIGIVTLDNVALGVPGVGIDQTLAAVNAINRPVPMGPPAPMNYPTAAAVNNAPEALNRSTTCSPREPAPH